MGTPSPAIWPQRWAPFQRNNTKLLLYNKHAFIHEKPFPSEAVSEQFLLPAVEKVQRTVIFFCNCSAQRKLYSVPLIPANLVTEMWCRFQSTFVLLLCRTKKISSASILITSNRPHHDGGRAKLSGVLTWHLLVLQKGHRQGRAGFSAVCPQQSFPVRLLIPLLTATFTLHNHATFNPLTMDQLPCLEVSSRECRDWMWGPGGWLCQVTCSITTKT